MCIHGNIQLTRWVVPHKDDENQEIDVGINERRKGDKEYNEINSQSDK